MILTTNAQRPYAGYDFSKHQNEVILTLSAVHPVSSSNDLDKYKFGNIDQVGLGSVYPFHSHVFASITIYDA